MKAGQIDARFGHRAASTIPSPQYRKLKDQHPDFMTAVEALGKAARQAGPLDEESAQLDQVAAAAAIRSEGAVHSHAGRALDAGAEAAEVYHALLLLASTIGFPTVVAALSWAADVVEETGSAPD